MSRRRRRSLNQGHISPRATIARWPFRLQRYVGRRMVPCSVGGEAYGPRARDPTIPAYRRATSPSVRWRDRRRSRPPLTNTIVPAPSNIPAAQAHSAELATRAYVPQWNLFLVELRGIDAVATSGRRADRVENTQSVA